MRRFAALVAVLVFAFASIPVQAFSLDAADVNGDGEVTVLDATEIQRHLAGISTNQQPINSYEALELNVKYLLEHEEVSVGEEYEIYDAADLTADILEHRTEHNTLIVERVIGQVTDAGTGDGKVWGTDEYIRYLNVDAPIANGTVLISYFIYNPMSNGVDDIANRYDFILDRRYEV